MTGREHVALAAGSTFLTLFVAQHGGVNVQTNAIYLSMAVAAAGALAPDLDHPGSLASVTIPASLLVYGGAFLLLTWLPKRIPSLKPLDLSLMGPAYTNVAWLAVGSAMMLFLLSALTGVLFGHRGPVHSLAFGLGGTIGVLGVLAAFHAPLWLSLAFAWGWLTHIASDAMTPAGLDYVMWPFGQGRLLN